MMDQSHDTKTHSGAASAVWIATTRLIAAAVFAQSLLAGLLLSGQMWSRTAHQLVAYSLALAVPVVAVVAALSMRHDPAGQRLLRVLLMLSIGIAAQVALGVLSAGGMRLLWAHVPLGVALVGLAAELPGVAQAIRAHAPPSPATSTGTGVPAPHTSVRTS